MLVYEAHTVETYCMHSPLELGHASLDTNLTEEYVFESYNIWYLAWSDTFDLPTLKAGMGPINGKTRLRQLIEVTRGQVSTCIIADTKIGLCSWIFFSYIRLQVSHIGA